MRVEKYPFGTVRIWFAVSELSFEGGAQYKELSEEQYMKLRTELEQAFCTHGTSFQSEDGTTWCCLDCGFVWTTS